MLKYPFDATFQRQQPLVVLDDDVLVITRSRTSLAALQTAAGVRHALGRMTTVATLWKTSLQRLLPDAEAMLNTVLPRRVAELQTDPVAYFVDYLAPVFLRRDFSEEGYAAHPSAPVAMTFDWHEVVAVAARKIPAPAQVSPAIWFCGRIWKLRPQPRRSGVWQVYSPNECFGLSGEYQLVRTLAAEWQRAVACYISQVAERLAVAAIDEQPLSCVVQVRQEANSKGYLQRGDLLFLAGNPPWLGHILPAHYSRTLGRESRRDLAMTTPLTLPPTPYPSKSNLAVHEKVGGTWRPVTLPHGLCLGPDSPIHPQDSPGVGLAAFLRFAALRFAENGIFHSSDEATTTTDDAYNNGYY